MRAAEIGDFFGLKIFGKIPSRFKQEASKQIPVVAMLH